MTRLSLLCIATTAAALISQAASARAQTQAEVPPVMVVEQGSVPQGYGGVQVEAQPAPNAYSGYLVAPSLDPNWVNARMQELAALDEEYGQYSLALPITMTVVGGVVFGVAGFTWLLGSLICDGFSGDCSDFKLRWGLVTLGGAALLTVGIVTMVNTTRARRPIALRMRQIRTELRAAGVQVAWGIVPTSTGVTAGLTMSF